MHQPLDATLLSLCESSEQLMAIFDGSDRLRWANAAFRGIFELEQDAQPLWEELMRRSWERGRGSHIVTDDFEAWLSSTKSRRGKQSFRTFEADLTDGRWILMGETTRSDGWMLCIASDVTAFFGEGRALRQERDHARRAALTDELTQLPNRRHLMQQLQAMSARTESGYALVLLDLDHFKHINDRHGHGVGDQVLRHFAQSLQALTRRDDFPARWGGEEFALLIPHTDREHIVPMLDRLLRETRAALPCPGLVELSYTVSAGLALVRQGEAAAALIERADAALYAAKTQGRDRWVLAP